MDVMKERKRWPLTLIIIAAVVIVSATIIYNYRDAPGRLPVGAISDSSGGVIVAWQDDSGIYAQRVDSSGQIRWERGGVLIGECPPGSGFNIQSDGLGGAIITWNDRSGIPDDHDDPAYFDPVPFHAQRISTRGELLWSDTLVSAGRKWQVVPDSNGSAIFAWDGYKTYFKGLHDDYLRLQKITPDGRRLWGDNGLLIVASSPFRPVAQEETASGVKGTAIRSRPTYEGTHYIVTDGAGGVIILWEEDTGGEDNRVYAQRLDGEGNYAWPDKVTTAATELISAESDGEGGVKIGTPQITGTAAGTVIAYARINGDGEVLPTLNWQPGITQQDSLPHEIKALRLDAGGSVRWGEKDTPIFNLPDVKYQAIVNAFSDDSGGAIIAAVEGKGALSGDMVYVQRLDINGNRLWGDGVRIDR